MKNNLKENTELYKVAKLIVAIGPENSKEILKYLPEEDVKKIMREIIEIKNLSNDEAINVIKEFTSNLVSGVKEFKGGIGLVKEIIANLYESNKANEILNNIYPEESPFAFIEDVDTSKIVDVIKNEEPQVIAVILVFLNPKKVAEILSYFSPELSVEIAKRISQMDKNQPDIEMVNNIVDVLKNKLVQKGQLKIDGKEKLIKILQESDKKILKEIIEYLEKTDTDLSNYVKRELFKFEELKNIEDRYMQRILREVESKELVVAMKGVSEELKNKIFNNMSERGAEMLKDDIEATGPLKREIVEEAQQKILSVVRKLEANGEIVLPGGTSDVVV